MHIDWFVFLCQIVNLLLLLFLLKKFLYGRIIGAMDAREARISATFEQAEKAREEARAALERQERRLADFESEHEAMMNKAREDAEVHRRELMESAREQIEQVQARWIETIRSERDTFLHELRRLAGNQIYSITRQVLKDLAGLELETRIVEILMNRIETLNEEERGKFRTAVPEGGSIIVQSAFDIPEDEQRRLDEAIHRCIAGGTPVVFERSENIMMGYELKTDGHKISWSIKDYMDSLEEKFYHALYEEAREKR